jgi:hypothetical protein
MEAVLVGKLSENCLWSDQEDGRMKLIFSGILVIIDGVWTDEYIY